MPHLLHLNEGEELPFVVRGRYSTTSSIWGKRKLRKFYNKRVIFGTVSVGAALLICVYTFANFISLSEISQEIPQTASKLSTIKENLEKTGAVLAAPNQPKFDGPINERQNAVRNAFKHAWKGYKAHAWGHDTLKPISGQYAEWMECGLTILDSLDTIIIMDLKDEYEDAKNFVKNQLSFDRNRFVSLFETTIRALGGLLSAYHLTGEKVFIEKAEDLGQRLLGAMDSPSPIPYSDVNLQQKSGKQPSWTGASSLAEVTSIQLEFRDLSRVLNNDTYEKAAFRISEHIHEIGCKEHGGLCGMFIMATTGKFEPSTTITFGARGDSYYEYLFKQWLQTGKTIHWLIEDYKISMDSMMEKLLRYSEPNNFAFIGELLGGKNYSPKMDHLVCFLAGTLALGTQNGMPQSHMDLAKNLGKTCHEMYKTPTGLSPEIAYFNMLPGLKEDINIKPLDAHYLLRPEAIEAWFYLYRITGDKQYQEWGWSAFEAIEKYAKVENGYASINNVKKTNVTFRDSMESFFLAETLKYLYLLLADDQTLLPLHKYVFNTEGHPLPIYSN